MIIPINFVVGAAAGAVTTYVLKDDSTKQWLKNTGSKVTGVFKRKPKEDVTEEAVSGDVIDGKSKDVTDKVATAS